MGLKAWPMIYRLFALLGILSIGSIAIMGCAQNTPPPSSQDAPQVVVSIGPLGYFTQRIGGDRVQVHVLLGPGTSPHDFEPTPAQMRLLQQADLLVLNGIGLEYWADKLVNSVDNSRLQVVITGEGLAVLQGAEGEGGNPHVWLDPINAALQAARIRDALIRVDPDGKATYLANSARLIEDLKALDRDVMLALASLPQREVVSLHAAWAYFARRYRLIEVAVIQERPGEEPSPGELAALVQQARAAGVWVIIVEPQMSARAAEAIAAEANMRIVTMDPIGQPPAYDYLRTMKENVAALVAALEATAK